MFQSYTTKNGIPVPKLLAGLPLAGVAWILIKPKKGR